MNILIVNLHAMTNRGDGAINYVSFAFLRQAFPGAHITLAANHPNEFVDLADAVVPSFKTWVWSADRRNRATWHPLRFMWFVLAVLSLCYWRLRKRLPLGWQGAKRALLQAYADADLVIGCGGTMFYARHPRALMFWVVCLTLWCAKLCRKPLVMLPQTIGPFHNSAHVWSARQTLEEARLIMLRDEESRHIAVDILRLPPQRVIVSADLALFLGDVVHVPALPVRHDHLIGVSVMHWEAHTSSFRAQAAYETALAGAVTALARQGYRIAFLVQSDTPTWGDNDEVPIKRIVEQLDPRTQAAIEGAWTVPLRKEGLSQFYGQFRLVIATRLHAMILSVAAGTPVVPIAYTSKNWAFVHNTELASITLDIATVTADAIVAASTTVLNDYACWQQRIAALVQQKRAQANVVTMLQVAVRAD